MPLSLLFALILANFCSQVLSSQSGSIKSPRPLSLKRDESNLLTKLYRKEETIHITENGCISSPRFPNSYPRNLLLTWKLSSAENTRIQLAFDSQFGLEEQENDVCRYDFVEVEEDSETSSVIRGRWCGHKEVPSRLTSKANQIKVTFKSDDHFVAKPGFKICYSLVEEDIPTQTEEGECPCASSPQKNDFLPAASETNWESVTSSFSELSYHSPSVTGSTVTTEALDQTIAQFDTVEEVLKHFNPESWQEDLENLYTDTSQFRGRTFQEKKSKVNLDRLNDDVKRYSCTPRNYTVNLREELKITNAVFFPRCLLIKRCGGNCGCGTPNWKSCICTAGKTVKKYHEVLKVMPENSNNKKTKSKSKNMSIVDIQLEHHERCDCICSSRPPR
ncbi:platelet-derived growth factor D-like [Xenopus laevis]|uniref:Platelet-derived growth factor D n=1 Tax=Xenopus laevis TaxID=8355 RepID=A0A8J1MA82_XENLA|nr:platelet-derived growth factor D-like [Xenopus laevis]